MTPTTGEAGEMGFCGCKLAEEENVWLPLITWSIMSLYLDFTSLFLEQEKKNSILFYVGSLIDSVLIILSL